MNWSSICHSSKYVSANNNRQCRNYKIVLTDSKEQKLGVICAAGHALGLLTNEGPKPWHPAGEELLKPCKQAAEICKANGIELGKLAMYYFIKLEGPATFLVGMQSEELLAINLDAYFNGLTPKEAEILDELQHG